MRGAGTPGARGVSRLALRLIPADWRTSVAGDLEEERARRRARGQSAGTWWASAALIRVAVDLRTERGRRRLVRRPVNGGASMGDVLITELRHACRTLVKQPGWSAVTLATLTIGIGANTALFSLANWLMLRPVPGVTGAGRLVTMRLETAGGAVFPLSLPTMRALTAVPALAATAAAEPTPLHIGFAGGAPPRRMDAEVVTGNFFDVLGQRLSLGRGFTADEAGDPAAADVAVLSDDLWHAAFGGARDVLGTRISVNAHPFTIVGVAAPGFRGAGRTARAELWLPIAAYRHVLPGYPADLLTNTRIGVFLTMFGRLAPGASPEDVIAQTEVARARLTAGDDSVNGVLSRGRLTAAAGLDAFAWERTGLENAFAVLGLVVALLLVLTCANAGNLVLAHTLERHGELAARQALGASRARIALHVFADVVVLCATAGMASLGLTWGLARAAQGALIVRNLPSLDRVGLDWRVFGFAFAASTAVALAVAAVAVWYGGRVDLAAWLTQSGRGRAGSRRRVRQALSAIQVAVSLALLTCALLLTRSMLARHAVPLGFDTRDVLAFSVEPGLQGYSPAREATFFRTLVDRVRAVPGVRDAGLAWIEPFRSIGGGTGLRPEGAPQSREVTPDFNAVSPGFFQALGIRLIAGRDFRASETYHADEHGGGVVIVNASLASALFGTTDVVGRRVTMSYPAGRIREIVGVVADTRTRRVTAPPMPIEYEPFGESFLSGWGTVHVRLAAPPAEVVPRVRQVVSALDPQLPVYDVETLDEAVTRYLGEDRTLTRVTMTMAVLATLLSAFGLYGVLGRGVAERRREFGIRAALGARPAAVVGLIMREAVVVAGVGAVAGLCGTYWLAGVIRSRLFGVTAFDPASLGLALGLVAVVTLAASLAPARRASAIDPAAELR
jgi:putative ABC transport system permease protein